MPTPTTIVVDQGDNQSAQINHAFGSPVFCRLFDELGNWMVGASVEFLPANGTSAPSGQFTGTFGSYFPYAATTGGDGRASSSTLTANGFVGAWVGSVYAVGFPAVTTPFSMTNTLSPPAPALTTVQFVSGQTQKAARSTAYQAVVVRCFDQFGAPFVGGSVTMTCPAGRGTFPGGFLSNTVTSGAGGDATFAVFTASATLGTFAPTVTGSGIPTIFASFKTIDPAVVTSLSAYAGSNQSTPPSFPFGLPLTVRAANELNNPVAGAVVTFTLPGAGASAVWNSPFTNPVTVATDVNGLGTTPGLTANATAGTYSVPATKAGAQTANFQLTNGGLPPADSSGLLMCEV